GRGQDRPAALGPFAGRAREPGERLHGVPEPTSALQQPRGGRAAVRRHRREIRSTGSAAAATVATMTDPSTRQALTELFAGQGWPAEAEELLRRGLAPRAPELALDAPGRLGLGARQLALGAR